MSYESFFHIMSSSSVKDVSVRRVSPCASSIMRKLSVERFLIINTNKVQKICEYWVGSYSSATSYWSSYNMALCQEYLHSIYKKHKLLKRIFPKYTIEKSNSILTNVEQIWALNMGQPHVQYEIQSKKKKSPDAQSWDSQVQVYMIPWGCPFPAIFLEHSSKALWMSLAQEIWDLIMPRYCA